MSWSSNQPLLAGVMQANAGFLALVSGVAGRPVDAAYIYRGDRLVSPFNVMAAVVGDPLDITL